MIYITPSNDYLCVPGCSGATCLCLAILSAGFLTESCRPLFRWDQCNRPANLQPSTPGPQVQV